MNDKVDSDVGQCCNVCGGGGENYCEYAHAIRKCPECLGTGIVDEDERKRELAEFAGDCIRNSGGDPDLPN